MDGNGHETKSEHKHPASNEHYWHLVLMIVLSFIAMYVLMYAMVNTFANVYSNLNQFYMAGLMAMPMVAIELVVMRAMYKSRKLNGILLAGCAIVGFVFWTLIRQQVAIGDRQFLRSMIPHHGAAILMCEQAPVTDRAIKELCTSIVRSQQSEIDQMKAMLDASR